MPIKVQIRLHDLFSINPKLLLAVFEIEPKKNCSPGSYADAAELIVTRSW
jgi:hypothetical protein